MSAYYTENSYKKAILQLFHEVLGDDYVYIHDVERVLKFLIDGDLLEELAKALELKLIGGGIGNVLNLL